MTSSKYTLLLLIISTIIVLLYKPPSEVFGESPSFTRQIIRDNPNDWIVATSTSYLPPRAQNMSECVKWNPSLRQYGFPLPDISAVSYFSNGNALNATLWLSSLPIDLTPNVTTLLDQPIEDVHLYGIVYGMLVDVHSAYGIEETDYEVSLSNIFGNNWTRIVTELSPTKETKVLDQKYNYTGFFQREKRYVDLSLDLDAVTSPNEYSISFYTKYLFMRNDRLCVIYDTTSKVEVPPPEFTLSASPRVAVLRPGEEKIFLVEMNSTTKVGSIMSLSSNEIDGIQTEFIPYKTEITHSGVTASALRVKALENATYLTYTIPIFANISLPRLTIPPEHSLTTPLLDISPARVLNTNLTINVLPPGSLSNPFEFSIPTEVLASLYGIVVTAIIGSFIPSIVRWFNANRQRGYLGRYMATIDGVHDTSHQDKEEYLKRLNEIRKMVQESFTKGKISESQYEILNNKISDYDKETNDKS